MDLLSTTKPNSYEIQKGEFLLSTDPSKLDFDMIHDYLCYESYWSFGISRQVVETAAKGATCFGIYHKGQQIGYTRLISDGATFGYLADVFILEAYRGQGLGQWLISTILTHPSHQGFRRWVLATRDAHDLYAKFGFTPLARPDVYMEKIMFTTYPPTENQQKTQSV